ncbi:prepilin peptidase [Alicyclobacillus fodiniaquatilis]|uniref:Prepilin peptidase n=1 Tax=Alicyclobacillus fodiniaquatilis TaxID=1661150 RepID=A0ABW4JMM0_9BACL
MILIWVIIGVILLMAAWQDIRTHQIHFLATFSGVMLGLIIHAISHGWYGLIISLIGLLTGAVLAFPLWKFARMGEGDVLLYCAIGALLGPESVMASFAISNAMILLFTFPELLGKRAKKSHPLAPWIAAGTVIGAIVLRFLFSF